MSGKRNKKVRQEIKRQARNDIGLLFNMLCDSPLRIRLRMARRIILRQKQR